MSTPSRRPQTYSDSPGRILEVMIAIGRHEVGRPPAPTLQPWCCVSAVWILPAPPRHRRSLVCAGNPPDTSLWFNRCDRGLATPLQFQFSDIPALRRRLLSWPSSIDIMPCARGWRLLLHRHERHPTPSPYEPGRAAEHPEPFSGHSSHQLDPPRGPRTKSARAIMEAASASTIAAITKTCWW